MGARRWKFDQHIDKLLRKHERGLTVYELVQLNRSSYGDVYLRTLVRKFQQMLDHANSRHPESCHIDHWISTEDLLSYGKVDFIGRVNPSYTAVWVSGPGVNDQPPFLPKTSQLKGHPTIVIVKAPLKRSHFNAPKQELDQVMFNLVRNHHADDAEAASIQHA